MSGGADTGADKIVSWGRGAIATSLRWLSIAQFCAMDRSQHQKETAPSRHV